MTDKQLKNRLLREVQFHFPYAPPTGERPPYETGGVSCSRLLPSTPRPWIYAAGTAAGTAAQNAPQPSMWTGMLPIIIVFAVMIFFMMRSQKKQQQKRQEMLDKIVKGSRVLLNSGMLGNVTEVREKTFVVEIADKVQVEVVKNGIADVVEEQAAAEKKA